MTKWAIMGGGTLGRRTFELLQVLYPDGDQKIFDDGTVAELKLSGGFLDGVKFLAANPDFAPVLALGFGWTSVRRRWIDQIKFSRNLIHPDCSRFPSVDLGSGNLVIGGARFGSGVRLGTAGVVYTGAILEAEVVLGSNVIVGPGAIICSGVRLADDCAVGAGAIILPEVAVGKGATIGAGALVRTDVAPAERIVGVPGRTI